MTKIADSWWRDYGITVGSRIEADNNGMSGQLVAADKADRDILGASFRLPSRVSYRDWPVNVTITGRTVQRRFGSPRVRVRIEYVQDGEPNTFGGGWLWLD